MNLNNYLLFISLKKSSKTAELIENDQQQYDSNNENEANERGNDESSQMAGGSTNNKADGGGIAAAGFKKFVKKSISIQIKTNVQGGPNEAATNAAQSANATQLTDVQKQQQAISNKLKQQAKKQKDEPPALDVHHQHQHQHHQANNNNNNKPLLEAPPLTRNQLLQQLQQQQQQQMSGPEKLRAQYNQFQSMQNNMGGALLNPSHNIVSGGLLPTPQMPPAFLHGPPPSTFAFPPPPLNANGGPPLTNNGPPLGTNVGNNGPRHLIQGPPPNLAMMHPHAQIVGALPLHPGHPQPGLHPIMGNNFITSGGLGPNLLPPPYGQMFHDGSGVNMFGGFNQMQPKLGLPGHNKMGYPYGVFIKLLYFYERCQTFLLFISI